MENYAKLPGASGTFYAYQPTTIDAPWENVAGNYAFALQTELGYWRVFYVGETSSLQECFSSPGRWPEAVGLGCTHVLFHLNDGGAQARQLEERDLVEGMGPPMNGNFDPMAQTWT